jgi:hypothetical protein
LQVVEVGATGKLPIKGAEVKYVDSSFVPGEIVELGLVVYRIEKK